MDLTGCVKVRSQGRFVTGHDFSRAESAPKPIWALAPATPDCREFAGCFRSLFRRAANAAQSAKASAPGLSCFEFGLIRNIGFRRAASGYILVDSLNGCALPK